MLRLGVMLPEFKGYRTIKAKLRQHGIVGGVKVFVLFDLLGKGGLQAGPDLFIAVFGRWWKGPAVIDVRLPAKDGGPMTGRELFADRVCRRQCRPARVGFVPEVSRG